MSSQGPGSTSASESAPRRVAVIVAASLLVVAIILKLVGISGPLFFILMFAFWAFLLYVGADVLSLLVIGLVILGAIAGAALAGGDDVIWGAIIGGGLPVAIIFLVSVAVILGPPLLAGYAVHEALGGGCFATGLAFITFAVVLLIVYVIAAFLMGFVYAAITGELALSAAALVTGMIDTTYLASSLGRGDVGSAFDAFVNMLQAHACMQVGHVLVIIGALVYGIICVALFLREGLQKRPLSLAQVIASYRGKKEPDAPESHAGTATTWTSTQQLTLPMRRVNSKSLADDLRTLEEDRRQGRIDEQEYQRRRKRILEML